MEETCLRNLSCKCSQCVGVDVDFLLSVSRNITSTINYADGEAKPISSPATSNSFTETQNPLKKKDKNQRLSKKREEIQNTLVKDEKSSVITSMEISTNEECVPMDICENLVEKKEESNTSESGNIEPLSERLISLSWKTRKQAYDDLKSLFEKGEYLTDYTSLFQKFASDSNASALDSAFDTLLAYVDKVSKISPELLTSFLSIVIDKGFAGRPGTVQRTDDLLQKLIEIGSVTQVIEELVNGLSSKKPKTPPACISCIINCLKSFGPKVIPLPLIKAQLSKLTQSTVAAVRSQTMNLLIEIYRWTGPALLTDVLSQLKPVQQSEYESLIKDIQPGEAVPSKTLRGALPLAVASRKKGEDSSSSSGVSNAFDPREFAETVNLLDKLPKTEFRTRLELPKWSEKVAALDIVLDIIGPIPKLAPGDYGELVNTMKTLMTDANVQIVTKAITVVGALSDGLQRTFSPFAKLLHPILFKKLSDKKASIITAANKTLDTFQDRSLPLEGMLEELKISCNAKTTKSAPARVLALEFISRCCLKKIDSVIQNKSLVGELAQICLESLEDVDPKVRSTGQQVFQSLLKMDDSIPSKISGILQTMQRVNSRAYNSIMKDFGPSVTTAAVSKAAPAIPSKSTSSVVGAKPSASVSRKPRTSKFSAPVAAQKVSTVAVVQTTIATGDYMDITSYITKDLLDRMKNESDKFAWKTRQDAMEQVIKIITDTGNKVDGTKSIHVLLKALKLRLNDSNANLKIKATQVVGYLGNSLGENASKYVKLIGENLLLGVGDIKKPLQGASLEALDQWVLVNGNTCLATFEGFLAYLPMALNNVNGRKELLEWVEKHCKNYKGDMSFLLPSILECLQDRSVPVRIPAQKILQYVVLLVGKEAVQVHCRDIKPAALRALQPILDKVFEDQGNETVETAVTTLSNLNIEQEKEKEIKNIFPSKIAAIARPSIPTILEDQTPLMLFTKGKEVRLDKARRTKWVLEDAKDLEDRKLNLQEEWAPYLSPSFRQDLFADSYDKGLMAAIPKIEYCIETLPDQVIDSLDLILKWSTMRIIDNHVQALGKMLDVLVKLFEFLVSKKYELHDVEASIFLPYLLRESGNPKPRFKARLRVVMEKVLLIYPVTKFSNYLVDSFLSKNTRSKSACLDFAAFVIQNYGFLVIKKSGIKEMVKCVEASEKDVRESAINALMEIYLKSGSNITRFYHHCGVTNQKSIDLLNGRIKTLPQVNIVSSQSMPLASTGSSSISPLLPNSSPLTSFSVPTSSISLSSSTAPPVSSSFLQNRQLDSPLRYDDSHIDVENYSSTPPVKNQIEDMTSLKIPISKKDNNQEEQELEFSNQVIEQLKKNFSMLFIEPIKKMVVFSSRVPFQSREYRNGKDALKAIIALAASDVKNKEEQELLSRYADDIVQVTVQCFQSCFQEQELDIKIIALCLACLSSLYHSSKVASQITPFTLSCMITRTVEVLADRRLQIDEETEPDPLKKRIIFALNKLPLYCLTHVPRNNAFQAALLSLSLALKTKGDDPFTKVRNDASREKVATKIFMQFLVKDIEANKNASYDLEVLPIFRCCDEILSLLPLPNDESQYSSNLNSNSTNILNGIRGLLRHLSDVCLDFIQQFEKLEIEAPQCRLVALKSNLFSICQNDKKIFEPELESYQKSVETESLRSSQVPQKPVDVESLKDRLNRLENLRFEH